MDSIVSAALEEVCAEGPGGIALPKLWRGLRGCLVSSGLPLDDGVKGAIWGRLLVLPGLQFKAQAALFDPRDPFIGTPEESEKLGLKLVAAEDVRDSFLGISDLKAANVEVTLVLKQVLERLAVARSDGIAQSQLSKEFKMKENQLFYYLKRLESQGLIVRQSTILRTKEAPVEGDDEMKDGSIVNTNLIYLYRYAKRLGSLQRLEVTAPYTPGLTVDVGERHLGMDDTCGESLKEDVHVKDFLPEMQAICNMLEEDPAKVRVVSEIKQARGYRMTKGHRNWRNICNRMKEARLTEEFQAKVNGKIVKCLRLLKNFNPKDFQPKTMMYGYENSHSEPLMKCGRRGQITEQIVELPIEQRIYDMIDAEGPKGITISEVSKSLGLNSKRTEARIYDMCWRMPRRFPMHMQFENHNRTKIYRVWTLRNFERYSSNVASGNCENHLNRADVSRQCEMDLVPYEQSAGKNLQSDFSPQELHFEKEASGQVRCASPNVSLCLAEEDKSIFPVADPQDQVLLTMGIDYDAEPDAAGNATKTDGALSERSLPVLSGSKVHSFRKYPSVATVESTQREERIMSRLQSEKFLLTVELYKWLEGLEKDKQTTMARKTLTRSLQKLQQGGYCKCIKVSVPVLTNCKRRRATEVILHPSVVSLSSELLGQIHKRLRDFDMQNRGRGLTRPKNDDQYVTELADVNRHTNRRVRDVQSVKVEAMRINGYVPANMVRAKLLHNFLWSHLRGLPDWEDALTTDEHNNGVKNPHSTLKSFSLISAIDRMPLELFLQVVGSEKMIDNLVERCKLGLRLSDLPVHEYKSLMDTLSTGRLSRVIDVLFRLKLIQLATEGMTTDTTVLPHCVSMHSLELRPYIEVPRSLSSSDANSFAYPPRLRHDFVLSSREAVDSYWQTLEYCYVAADRASALHAFPGSAVPEVSLARSWTSVRVMTAEQHMKLLRRLESYEPNKKIPLGECVKISKELDLTLEQVLRASYDMRQPHRRRLLRRSKRIQQELNLEIHKSRSVVRKRKRPSKAARWDQIRADSRIEETSISRTFTVSGNDEESMGGNARCPAVAQKHDTNSLECGNVENASISVDFRTSKEGDDSASIKQCSVSRKKFKRQRKFSWSDILDRKLIIEYVKYRAPFGAKFCRVDWASIPDLPTDPDTCKRRMYALNSNRAIRKTVLKLCNIVGARYAKFLSKTIEERVRSVDGSGMVNNAALGQENWDDFEYPLVKMAVDEVLHCKSMANLENTKRIGSRHAKNVVNVLPSNSDVSWEKDPKEVSSTVGIKSSSHPSLLDERCSHVCRQVQESLSVANAVELFKLVFLSTSTAPEVRSLLSETLKWYSERDLTIAFNYLKSKKLMEHGHGSQQVFLSQRFLHDAYSSPFPVDSGKRAAKFSSWLLKEEKNLMEDGVDLNLDLQCGEVFHLFALFSSGRLSIAPCMPKEGFGEADGPKSLKCESSEGKLNSDDRTLKQKAWWRKDSEPCNRREKGFPGIKLFLKRRIITTAEAVAFLPEKESHSSPLPFVESRQEEPVDAPFQSPSGLFSGFGTTTNLLNVSLNDSLWESMASYANSLSSTVSKRDQGLVSPECIRNVYNAIHQAGEHGLSINEVSENIVMHGSELAEIFLETLEEFRLIMKVNAYDHVRAVDASYKPKYFITTLAGHKQDSVPESSQQMSSDMSERCLYHSENSRIEAAGMHAGDGHVVTPLELSEGPAQSCVRDAIGEGGVSYEECTKKEGVLAKVDMGDAIKFLAPNDTRRCRPILPWINGDGSINRTLYRGLMRRILGTAMQNPGILEEDLISRMDVLNPQSCRRLLELMVLDNHIIVKMYRTTSCGPPSILEGLFAPHVKLAEPVFRKHYFTNPMSTSLL
uniref:Transcription factor tau subunit sfc3 n=1 Tax=Anthurium amnicola TaxID=1678845 RepID=A0A1D1ZGL8_9ARAE